MKKRNLGFTMIELLIVIAVLGILAVAVLAAINPIEQINRGRDTGSRSDAEQLLSAVDRYYTVAGFYPWRSSTTEGTDALAFTRLTALADWADDLNAPVLTKLSAGGTSELKQSFTDRVVGTQYNYLFVYNAGAAGNSTYICFNGQSQSFQTEASERCAGTRGSIPADLLRASVCDVTVDGELGQFLSCLP
jgi:prepilin-type N-terminal cleavage/methylation domain-containing protein